MLQKTPRMTLAAVLVDVVALEWDSDDDDGSTVRGLDASNGSREHASGVGHGVA